MEDLESLASLLEENEGDDLKLKKLTDLEEVSKKLIPVAKGVSSSSKSPGLVGWSPHVAVQG